MLLCDRYYGSAELFLYCRLYGYKLLVRAKSYMYKDQVAMIEEDGMIHLDLKKHGCGVLNEKTVGIMRKSKSI